MEQENLQQATLDEALVPINDQVKIGACNMRIDQLKNQKEPNYHLTLDIIKHYSCYNAFLITADVPQIYMQQFWYTISKNKNTSSYQFQIDNQKFEIGVKLFRDILWITPKVPNQEFVAPPPHDALVSFVKQLGYKGSLELVSKMYIDHIYQSWGTFLYIINRKISNTRLTADKPVPRDGNRCLILDSPREKSTRSMMSIPDAMMNDEIRSSVPYLTYLALSTNTKVDIPKVGKGRGKGVTRKKKAETVVPKEKKKATTPRKRSSITANDNIVLDPDEALKNLEAKEVADSAESEETEDDEVQPLIRRSTEVLDEPKDNFGSSSNSLSGSDDEVKDVSSDDEIKADENKAEEGKDTEEQAEEEPPVDNQAGMEQAGGEHAKV
ncbi:hypothetical protein Tco_1186435 [Tanacetum coccineum]